MIEVVREFRVGRPQVYAGLMLLAFMAQCLWTADTRKLSDLEYRYIAAGLPGAGETPLNSSPFTSLVAAFPVRFTSAARKIATPRLSAALAVPRPWLLRLPFAIFGVWLGAALWWVARRLFDDAGGYVALALYCTSPAMVIISSNIGPEILLAWSSLGLIYTAIGVSHTLYAPPKKWAPRIMILGLSIGFALATVWWSFTLVLLAFAFMMYLAPGCRRKALMVLASASVIGCGVWGVIYWLTGSFGLGLKPLLAQKPTIEALGNLAFPLSGRTDGYVLVFLFIAALAQGAVHWQHRSAINCPYCRAAIQPGSCRPRVGRNFRVEFYLHIHWRFGRGLSGNTLPAASCLYFDCMFPAPKRSNGAGP